MIQRLLDSVILIDHLNEVQQSTQYILDLDPLRTAISVITRAEVLAGVEVEDHGSVLALLDQYRLLIIDKPAADMAAYFRKLHGWKLPDAFQAALAQCHGIKLVTRNTNDFDPEKHPFVKIPYVL